MRLLLLSNYFPNPTDPIRGTFNLQQARALARLCEVRVAAPVQWSPVRRWHGAGPLRVPPYEVVDGLPTWHPRYVLTPGVARGTYAAQMAAAVLPALARIRREYPFDVLLATWAFPDVVVGAAAAALAGVPLLAKVHGSDINVQTGFPWRARQIRWALNRAHRVLAVSGALRDRLLALGVPDEKIMVHHNGVDAQRFAPRSAPEARRALGLPAGGRHVVFVGFFVEAKALHVLMEAVAALPPDVTVHLVGAGPLEADLRSQAAALSLGNRVRFHGLRPHPEIAQWMAAADVFCLPSIREGCPNVLLEALASGRPVVATRVGGIPEMIAPGDGLLVPPGDASALAGALAEALGRSWDPETLRARGARFSWDTGARALYEAAVEACGGAAPVRPLPDLSIAGEAFLP